MIVRENVLLAPFTTFRIGGPARYFVETSSEEELREALAFARARGLAVFVLGSGSNILISDEGVDALVIRPVLRDMSFHTKGRETILVAGAGACWDDVVNACAALELWGIENLAGIPGTTGGAAVQNIGAYGAEFSSRFVYAEALSANTKERVRITPAEAKYTYRDSVFKNDKNLIVTRVALALTSSGAPNLTYGDLARAALEGVPLATPAEVAHAVRGIRARKFPAPDAEGTAGSFFKNPVVSVGKARELISRYPGLPIFTSPRGEAKIPLAWLLDKALSLKGYARGAARLYEAQPLVLVARAGAMAADVEALARDVAERVREATGLVLEREVEYVGDVENRIRSGAHEIT